MNMKKKDVRCQYNNQNKEKFFDKTENICEIVKSKKTEKETDK